MLDHSPYCWRRKSGGRQVSNDRYVTFTDEELKSLEACDDHAIEIAEFIPFSQIDPIYFENSYYLGCEPASAKAYRLLTDAMTRTERVALGRFTMRGKEHAVVLRPYEKGVMMHTIYYADEVRPVEEIDRGTNEMVKDTELSLAERLIGELTSKELDLSKYHDSFRERVEEAAQQKMAGQQITAPEAPRRGQVIDLMAALRASLEQRGIAPAAEEGAAPEDDKAAVGGRKSRRARRAPAANAVPAAGNRDKLGLFIRVVCAVRQSHACGGHSGFADPQQQMHHP
jgi:DNA end-binding protein Ku